MFRFAPLVAVLLTLTGCGGSFQHLIQAKSDAQASNQPLIYSLDDQRRVAFSRTDQSAYCAEPPAAASERLTHTIADALAQISRPSEPATTRQVEQIYQRAHTLQLFRDAAFFLCLNALQKPASSNDYDQSLHRLIDQLQAPLMEEIKLFYKADIARQRHGSRQQVIVCTPNASASDSAKNTTTDASTEQAAVNCQQLPTFNAQNPSVIEPPQIPEPITNRPVM